jgi:hypothetical protein
MNRAVIQKKEKKPTLNRGGAGWDVSLQHIVSVVHETGTLLQM